MERQKRWKHRKKKFWNLLDIGTAMEDARGDLREAGHEQARGNLSEDANRHLEHRVHQQLR